MEVVIGRSRLDRKHGVRAFINYCRCAGVPGFNQRPELIIAEDTSKGHCEDRTTALEIVEESECHIFHVRDGATGVATGWISERRPDSGWELQCSSCHLPRSLEFPVSGRWRVRAGIS